MKKLLGKFGEYLYWKYGEPNIVSMTREQLGLFNKPMAFSQISKKDQMNYRRKAKEYMRDKILQNILSILVNDIAFDNIVDNSKKVNKDAEALRMDRYSINGIALFVERLLDLSSLLPQQEEAIDDEDEKYSIT